MNQRDGARILNVVTMVTGLAVGAVRAAADDGVPGSELSLGDLGISATQMQGDPAFQAQLERRTTMLKMHQILGLATAVPMVLTFATGPGGGDGGRVGPNGVIRPPRPLSHSQVMTHEWLGIGTTVLYATTASLALFAPNPEHNEPHGVSRVHRWLAWIHAPLMVAVPILGGLDDKYRITHVKAGQLGTAHKLAAGALLVAYGAAITVMTVNF